jgi:hypothetical protein
MAEPMDHGATPVDWDHIHRSNYASKLTNPTEWFLTGNELLAAAQALGPMVKAWWSGLEQWSKDHTHEYPEHSFHMVQMMLYAFAIENYFKGALAAKMSWQELDAVRKTGKLPRPMKSHDLVGLAHRTGFTTTLKEEGRLARLAIAAQATGRYPVPVVATSDLKVRLSDGQVHSIAWRSAGDPEASHELAVRIRDFVGAPESYRGLDDNV